MTMKKKWIVNCHYQKDGQLLQDNIERYFKIYFQNELEKMEISDEKSL